MNMQIDYETERELGILVTIAFSYIVFHEKLSLKSGTGLLLIVVGTLALLI